MPRALLSPQPLAAAPAHRRRAAALPVRFLSAAHAAACPITGPSCRARSTAPAQPSQGLRASQPSSHRPPDTCPEAEHQTDTKSRHRGNREPSRRDKRRARQAGSPSACAKAPPIPGLCAHRSQQHLNP